MKNWFKKIWTHFTDWIKSLKWYQLAWIVCSTLGVLILGIVAKDTWINILIGTIGMCYVSVYSTGARSNFLIGVVYVSLYSIICIQNKIYLDAIQNVVLIPLYIISFIQWGKHHTEPKNLGWKGNCLSILATGALFGILFGISRALNGNYSYLDALNTACTLTAMFLGIYGCSIVWLFWTINNVSSAIVFIMAAKTDTGSIAVMAMKIVFVINGLIGFGYFIYQGYKKKKELELNKTSEEENN